MSTCFYTNDKIAYHHTASSSVPASTASIHDAALVQRTNQVQSIGERLRNGRYLCLVGPIGVADHVAEYGGINCSRRSWVQAYYDLPQWSMR